MKRTTREMLEDMRARLSGRIFQLEKNIHEYKEESNFADAMISSIKKDQLVMIYNEIDKILQS